jgi:hypothetical protein
VLWDGAPYHRAGAVRQVAAKQPWAKEPTDAAFAPG